MQRALKKSHARQSVTAHNSIKKVKASKAAGRVRLNPEDRKKLIVEEAIRYFAEVGFDGGTRPLAVRLGITQPLIFRYFPNKNDLIEAVYHEVFLAKWRIEWEVLLADRTRPLRARLIEFYTGYTRGDIQFEMDAHLPLFRVAGAGPQSLVHQLVEERVHRRVCAEIRAEKGIKLKGPITGRELELYWVFHGGYFLPWGSRICVRRTYSSAAWGVYRSQYRQHA